MNYRVHHFQINMSKDKDKLESFLNNLKGEVVSIIPNVEPVVFSIHARMNFPPIVEKTE